MIPPESTTVPSKSKRTTGKRTRSIVASASEAQRAAQLVEQVPARLDRRQEPRDPCGLLLRQRHRGIRRAVRPDAEPELGHRLVVAQVARDSQRLLRIALHRRVRGEELDELAALRHSAPW